MAKKPSEKARSGNILFANDGETNQTTDTGIKNRTTIPVETEVTGNQKERSFLSGLGTGERVAAVAVCLLMVVGALGASGFGAAVQRAPR